MSAVVEDLLRLAWRSGAVGRAGMRDALLTLAVAEGGADDAVLAERCRRLLVAHRPDHCFAASATLGHALSRPRVRQALAKLRLMYPPARVRHLLLKGDAGAGPFTGRLPSLSRILLDLRPTRVEGPGDARRPEADAARAIPFSGGRSAAVEAREGNPDPDGKVAILYVSVLLALAVLLNGVLRPDAGDNKAA